MLSCEIDSFQLHVVAVLSSKVYLGTREIPSLVQEMTKHTVVFQDVQAAQKHVSASLDGSLWASHGKLVAPLINIGTDNSAASDSALPAITRTQSANYLSVPSLGQPSLVG